jgi:hypothetical protein
MKYFYFSLFIFLVVNGGFAQTLLNSNGNLPQNGDSPSLSSGLGGQSESLPTSQNALPPQKNNMLFNPNPATNIVRIGYSLAICSKVSLSVFNQIGQEVLSVIKEYQKEGNYYLDTDISRLMPGIYFVRLNVGKEIITKKLIVN